MSRLGALLGAIGMGGAGAALMSGSARAQAGPAQQRSAAEDAAAEQARIDQLERDLELFSNVDVSDAESVAAAQRRLGVTVDGRMGPESRPAIAARIAETRQDLEAARERLEKARGEAAYEGERSSPWAETARTFGPDVVAPVLGVGLGLLARRGVTSHARKGLMAAIAQANKLVTPGAVSAGRTGKRLAERINRVASVNEFWRLGGAGDRTPFTAADNLQGYKPIRKMASPSNLYPPDKRVLRSTDYGVIGGGLAESGTTFAMEQGVQEEVKQAQAAVDGGNKSPEAYRRLEDAKTKQAILKFLWRAGGMSALSYGGLWAPKLPYANARPDVRGAEAEMMLLRQFLKR